MNAYKLYEKAAEIWDEYLDTNRITNLGGII